jgi:hypothetical protein
LSVQQAMLLPKRYENTLKNKDNFLRLISSSLKA